MKPALTAEEWGEGSCDRDDHQIRADVRAVITRWLGADFDHRFTEGRHALAALCLYGQPFGFTRDEVRAIREFQRHLREARRPTFSIEVDFFDWKALADRIEALLPPE